MSNIVFWQMFDDEVPVLSVSLRVNFQGGGAVPLGTANAYTENLTTYNQEAGTFIPTPEILPLSCEMLTQNLSLQSVFRLAEDRAAYVIKMDDIFLSSIDIDEEGNLRPSVLITSFLDAEFALIESIEIFGVDGCPDFVLPED